MAFAMCPDDGLPRLFRKVEPGVLPDNLICRLDKEMNILEIDRERFEQLGKIDQHMMLRTQRAFTFASEFPQFRDPHLSEAAE